MKKLENEVDTMYKRYEKYVIIPDYHAPYEDFRALHAVYDFIGDYKPDHVIMLGDHVDFYALSKFDKNPERILSLQEELDVLHYHLNELRKVHKGPITYMRGNHEFRLIKYLQKNPEISSLRNFSSIPKFLDLNKYGIEFTINKMIHGVLFKHGDLVRKHSAYTAKGEFENEGTSGISAHCFDEETEALTQRGWVKGFDLKASDKVMTMNKRTKKGEWNKINKFFEFSNYKELFRIKGITNDLLVTGKHGLIFESSRGKLKEIEAKDMVNQGDTLFFFNSVGKQYNGANCLFDREAVLDSLLINIVTDGSFDGNAIRWHLKKQGKIDHLRVLLNLSKVNYSEIKQGNGNTNFRINVESSKQFIDIIGKKKQLGNWVKDIPAWLVLKEYSVTDGCKNSAAKNSYQLSSAKEHEIDLLQEHFTTNGYRATKNQHGTTWTLTVNTRQGTWLTKNNVSVEEYDGKVWCVNVDNGTLLVRRNGKVTVTLNTHRLSAHYKTNRSGEHAWFEMGHLCDEGAAEYMEGKIPDWQKGFGVMIYDKKRHTWTVHQFPIINNSFTVVDKTYSWRKNQSYSERECLTQKH